MSLTVYPLPRFDSAAIATRRAANVSGFLAARGLDAHWLERQIFSRVGSDGRLLLTSSPVHGLANATSDVDFIRVADGSAPGPRIATKIFAAGRHLEVVSFSEPELQAAFAHLQALASRPPAEIVSGIAGWDRQLEPRRKQTERIVNGMTLCGSAPYLEQLPALARVWQWASLQAAIEHVVFLALAEAAGELRGRLGYALNALLCLMDATLCSQGDVYTTRKWYLLRWRRFARAGGGDDAVSELVTRIERLRVAVTAGLRDASIALASQYAAAVSDAAALLGGVGRVDISLTLAEDADLVAFLPGASVAARAGTSMLIDTHQPLEPLGPISLAQVADLGAGEARWLGLARGRLAQLRVSYDEEDDS